MSKALDDLRDSIEAQYRLSMDALATIANFLEPAPLPMVRKASADPHVPLAERQKSLIALLARSGPATRASILSGTGIPPGSLSALLARGKQEGWLVRQIGGLWRLAEQTNSPRAGAQ